MVDTKIPKINEIAKPLKIGSSKIKNAPIIAAGVILFTSTTLQFVVLPLMIMGMFISLKATFAPFHLILEGYRPLAAIQCSFSSTRGRIGKIVLILLLFYFFTSIVDGLTNLKTAIEPFNVVIFFIGVAVTMLMVAMQQIAVFKLYIESFGQTDKAVID